MVMVIIISNIYAVFNTTCLARYEAAEDDGDTGDAQYDVTSSPGFWRPSQGNVANEFEGMLDNITGVMSTIGVIVSVGTLAVIGIKYLLGSIEERAQYKQTLVPWLIGAIMIFAITTIPGIIYDITKNILY